MCHQLRLLQTVADNDCIAHGTDLGSKIWDEPVSGEVVVPSSQEFKYNYMVLNTHNASKLVTFDSSDVWLLLSHLILREQ